STLSAAFALLATLLAAVGLYGVLAYSVAQRTREIGVRMALGADGGRVQLMVLRQVALMTLVGGIIGMGAAFALGSAAQSLLFEVRGHDQAVMVIAGVLLALVALASGYIPARRASRIDRVEALRYERGGRTRAGGGHRGVDRLWATRAYAGSALRPKMM